MADPGSSRATAAAIVAGAALIAAAVYFGLRSRAPQPPPKPVPVPRASVARMSAEDATSHASAALEAQRKELIASCWDRLDAGSRPERVHFTLEYVFDRRGKMLGYSLREDRSAADPAVTRCFQATVKEIRIPAPGAATKLEVELWLPDAP